MNDICYIYTLADPITNQIRYVGRTINPKERYANHKRDKQGKNYRINWIQSLKKKNLVPIFEIIDEVTLCDKVFWENYWISQFKTWGFKLVNAKSKGDGSEGFKHSKKARKLMSQIRIGIVFSQEHINNLKKSHIGKVNSYAHKKVIQIDLNNKIINEYFAIKEAEKLTGVNNSKITACCKGKRKTAGGFQWKYAT